MRNDEIYKQYQEGASITSIATKYGLSTERIRVIIRRYKVYDGNKLFDLIQKSVDSTDMAIRIYNIVNRGARQVGKEPVSFVMNSSEDELHRVRNMGPMSLSVILKVKHELNSGG